MALWGNKDDIGSGGVVSLDYSTGVVTGSGTTFGQVGAAATGDVIRFGDRSGTYFGDAVIVGIASTTQLSIGSTAGLSGASIASTSFTVSQLPKYTVLDSKYSEASYGTEDSFVYGVDQFEVTAAASTPYAVTHGGWVGVTTYVDMHGNLRVKNEVLVAGGIVTTSDAPDDAVFLDRLITILTNPSSTGVGTTATATFNVLASVVPSTTLSYQWQYSSTGIAYTNLSNDATYSGTTTAGLGVTNTDASLDGYYYRVVVSADAASSVTSSAAVMTVS